MPSSARSLHRPFKVVCKRCGQEMQVERGATFGDRDYYELWHEHMDLTARFKAALAFFRLLMRARNAPR